MKYLLRSYLWVTLLCVTVLSVLSYGFGAGYVYIYLRHWQIESNIWVLMIALGLCSLMAQLLWLGAKRYLMRKQRQQEHVLHFEQLHAYEKLAVLSVLDAEPEQKKILQEIYQPSILLKEIVQANMLWKSGQSEQALLVLEQSSSSVFELASLQRIEVYLAQGDGQQALSQLEFLSQHDLSPWLSAVAQGYQNKLENLWGQFAIQFPWHYLHASQFGLLKPEHKTQWLQQILTQYEQASLNDLEALQARYYKLLETQNLSLVRENRILWLKVLARMPDMAVQHTQLAEDLLNELFDQEVFYLWFESQWLKQQPDYADIESHLDIWEQKYTQLPIFAFSRWHIYQATGRLLEAEQLLQLFPDHLLMSYLRIKVQLQGQPQLSEQLNLLFEGNNNYLKINV
ncbi:heme biosynthesis protein HemY [Acinetobacter sp. MD2]|uniref:heme biosynthesis protein HemY n=1 Tax=Acinetobacter sp. MD2 TaxID=2600066 RepID=UPI002D1ED1CB|nr:heme biosynthesis protein HemY [Acinetobacter sp. MD2]MEB3766809.1 heme biosynthesis protein HemY [Acinetobacter sp. MD2]